MGLALHNPASSLADLTEYRHLLGRRELSEHRINNQPPLGACWSREKLHNLALRRFQNEVWPGVRVPLRPYQLRALEAAEARGRKRTSPFAADQPRRARKTLPRGAGQDDEDRELARSAVVLPGDAHRLADNGRPPSLERQGAFRDANTTKSRNGSQGSSYSDDAALDEAELYRIGLLYDDEHERGSGFDFSAIDHDTPLYSLHVRPEKRGRKRKAADYAYDLPLNLSFADLGSDEAIAAYLMAPDDMDFVSMEEGPETPLARYVPAVEIKVSAAAEGSESPRKTPPLPYVPSFCSTSQLPVHMVDGEDDDDNYDNDETASEAEHLDKTNNYFLAPSDLDPDLDDESPVPDLVPDELGRHADGHGGSYEEDLDKDGWALLRDDDDDDDDSGTGNEMEREEDARRGGIDTNSDAAPADADDAWVVLG